MDERTLEHIESAKALFAEQLQVKKEFDFIDISKGIDWQYKHHHNAKTYQVYLHSLGILKSLVIARNKLDNTDFLGLAREHLIDWKNGDFDKSNSQAWHEHAVSSRLQNIIYFQQRAEEFKLEEDEFQEIILLHCEFLSKKQNYHENNHGIMMDSALIFASKSIKNSELKNHYLELAYYRVKMALYRDFSKMGVHLENSPEYHKMVFNMYVRVSKLLSEAKMPLGKEISGLFNRARMYTAHMVKPDKSLPIIGDSSVYEEKISKKYTDFVDHEAGIVISQYRNLENEKNSSWLYFKSGYKSKTHKHKDDLSVNLYMNGHDILIDSGKYGYNIKDPVRQFIVSPKAHSTVYYKDSDYTLTNPYNDQIKLKTNKFENRVKYKVSSGINNLYPEGSITRTTVLTKDKIFMVFDRFISKEVNQVIQNFNIAEGAIITKIDANKFNIEIDERIYILENVKIDGNISKSRMEDGYVSYKFGTAIKNKRIEIEGEGATFGMLTILYESKENYKIENIRKDGSDILYDLNSIKHRIHL